jgi:hypothetical protein
MAKPLDFNKLKKRYLNVTLADEKQTTIMIGTPTKSVMDDLLAMRSALEDVESDDVDADVMNDLYDVCAKVMSRNKGGVTITADHLAECLDFEDIMIFFNAYMEFVGEIADEKN